MFRELFNGLVDARLGDLTQMQRSMRRADKKQDGRNSADNSYCFL